MNDRNLTLIDDALLTVGRLGLLLAGITYLCLRAQSVPVASWVHLLVNSALLGSILFIGLGLLVRRREKTSLRLWNLLQHNPDTRLSALVTQSRFSMADIRRAVRSLNDSGISHIIMDEQNDRLYDGRLDATFTIRHECSGCGAATEVTVNVQHQQALCCSYCQHPFPPESINALRAQRRQSVERINTVDSVKVLQQQVSFLGRKPAPSFSMLTFIVLLALFWPAAFFYAGRYALSRQRENEKLQMLIETQVKKLTALEEINASGVSTP